MTGDELRDQLAAALAEADGVLWNSLAEKIGTCDHYRRIADALLPVVRKIAADELRAAADDFPQDAHGAAWFVAQRLRDRADALDPS